MSPLLDVGTVLQEQYQVLESVGSAEGTAAYLVADLDSGEELLLWESAEDAHSPICLKQGSLTLSVFRLTSSEQAMVPSYGDCGREVEPTLAADALRFAAPEKEDVYALGASCAMRRTMHEAHDA